jgi:catalase
LAAGKAKTREASPNREIHAEGSGANGVQHMTAMRLVGQCLQNSFHAK